MRCGWTETQTQDTALKSQPKTLAGKLGGNAKRSVLRKKPGIGEKQTQKHTPLWGMLQTKTEDSKTGSRTTHIVPRETQHTDNSPREQGKGFWTGRQFYSVGIFFMLFLIALEDILVKMSVENFIGSVTVIFNHCVTSQQRVVRDCHVCHEKLSNITFFKLEKLSNIFF